jgi:hypothetical protein
MKIVSLELEDHSLRSHSAFKSARGAFQNMHGVRLAVITARIVSTNPRALCVQGAGAFGCLRWWFHKGVKQQITALSWRQVDHAVWAKCFLTPFLRLGLVLKEKLRAAIRALIV